MPYELSAAQLAALATSIAAKLRERDGAQVDTVVSGVDTSRSLPHEAFLNPRQARRPHELSRTHPVDYSGGPQRAVARTMGPPRAPDKRPDDVSPQFRFGMRLIGGMMLGSFVYNLITVIKF